MRVLTYNVQSCRAGIRRVAGVLRKAAPDVVVLNEVRSFQAWRLSRATGMHVSFAATLPSRLYGNAVLSREKPTAVLAKRFTLVPPAQQRGMIAVTLPGGVTLAGVHLGLSSAERDRQVRELLAEVGGRDRLVVAGDFNEAAEGPAVRMVASRLSDAFAGANPPGTLTFPSWEPLFRIDYVFVSPGIRVVGARVLPEIASDHLAVLVDLALPDED